MSLGAARPTSATIKGRPRRPRSSRSAGHQRLWQCERPTDCTSRSASLRRDYVRQRSLAMDSPSPLAPSPPSSAAKGAYDLRRHGRDPQQQPHGKVVVCTSQPHLRQRDATHNETTRRPLPSNTITAVAAAAEPNGRHAGPSSTRSRWPHPAQPTRDARFHQQVEQELSTVRSRGTVPAV